jgi:hypothetical protein
MSRFVVGSPFRAAAGGHLATIVWFVTGMLWVAQAAVPWSRRGAFSSSTMLDGARLLHSGLVDAAVPRWAALLLLVVPVVGVVVGATAALRGTPLWVGRLICVAVVTVAFAAFMHNVAGANLSRLGPGGWLAGAGIVLGTLGLIRTRPTRGNQARELSG